MLCRSQVVLGMHVLEVPNQAFLELEIDDAVLLSSDSSCSRNACFGSFESGIPRTWTWCTEQCPSWRHHSLHPAADLRLLMSCDILANARRMHSPLKWKTGFGYVHSICLSRYCMNWMLFLIKSNVIASNSAWCKHGQMPIVVKCGSCSFPPPNTMEVDTWLSVASAQLGFFAAFLQLFRYRECSNWCNSAGDGNQHGPTLYLSDKKKIIQIHAANLEIFKE